MRWSSEPLDPEVEHGGRDQMWHSDALSSRGVGLDAVKSCIDGLPGTLEVKTVWEKGSRFSLTIPHTTCYGGLPRRIVHALKGAVSV